MGWQDIDLRRSTKCLNTHWQQRERAHATTTSLFSLTACSEHALQLCFRCRKQQTLGFFLLSPPLAFLALSSRFLSFSYLSLYLVLLLSLSYISSLSLLYAITHFLLCLLCLSCYIVHHERNR